MATEILTKEDLEEFKTEMFEQLTDLLSGRQSTNPISNNIKKRWLKSHEVERLLKISTTKLQVLRRTGVIPYSKIGNTIFYDVDDIDEAIEGFKIKERPKSKR
jgi:hypothetical protein